MDVPSYDALPVVDGARVSWGVLGGSGTGCLALVTPAKTRAAAGLVRRGDAFRLDAPLDEIDPPLFGRPALAHEVTTWPSGRALDDDVTRFNTQASSQWDGLSHILDTERRHYEGRSQPDLGIDRWPALATRGVLADVARWREQRGEPLRFGERDVVTVDDLRATLEHQGAAIEPGDVLLVHTGWLDAYRALPTERRAHVDVDGGTPGLEPGEAMAEYLWNLHVAGVAADNPALEARPAGDPSLHLLLIPRLGIPIGELWDLGRLAADCADDRRYDVFLTSAPLRLTGGVASPPNAIAVK